MQFILIKPVFSNHLSYVTQWNVTKDRFHCIHTPSSQSPHVDLKRKIGTDTNIEIN